MTTNYGFQFKEWDIYKDARIFRTDINKLTEKYPKEERFALVSQMKRATTSVVLNIAESANRGTDKDTRLFINRAHTSLDEVVACLDCSLDDNYITKEEYSYMLEKAKSLAKRLRAFSKHLS